MKIKIRPTDYLLILGAILAPMTGFRIWKVGPAEALCCIWAILNLKNVKFHKRLNFYLYFWIMFITSIVLGTIFSQIFYTVHPSALSGILTWIYFALISVVMYFTLKEMELAYVKKIIKTVFVCAGFWYLFLMLYNQFVSSSFLGTPLVYGGNRFSGGAENPHQIALFMLTTLFFAIFFISEERKAFGRIVSIGIIISSVAVIFETSSSTAIMAMVSALFIYVVINMLTYKNSARIMVSVGVFLLLVSIFIAVFYSFALFGRFYEWVLADPNGQGRIEIFSDIVNVFPKSPIFGLGPGVHAMDSSIEFHNNYLEILSMTGIFGSFVFLVLSLKIFKDTYIYSRNLVPLVLAVYVYGFSGFSARRLVYWISITFVLVIIEINKRRCRHGRS
ncbi:MAG: O-antigen ligase family protein [Oscillospiraceae bacterium]|nr:O-antigen ligase family protein [Oscillospiraceae bacterium]